MNNDMSLQCTANFSNAQQGTGLQRLVSSLGTENLHRCLEHLTIEKNSVYAQTKARNAESLVHKYGKKNNNCIYMNYHQFYHGYNISIFCGGKTHI